ncbi:MAG TPA: hypothetical protein VJS91_00405 [Nitrososphaeraceae archaeon]|nr:hypothetical protein [Nitrososphaeraceae archaeon]
MYVYNLEYVSQRDMMKNYLVIVSFITTSIIVITAAVIAETIPITLVSLILDSFANDLLAMIDIVQNTI